MTDLPSPLTPSDCDLRGFSNWMPLLGQRLFSSSWYRAARKDGRGGIAAIKLWWEAMLQCPAGSLPNDEQDLCMLADFGEDMRAWQRHRAVAMHGFILCSDNRWYHPVVCEQALKAFEKRQEAESGRKESAERMRRWRSDAKLSTREWNELRASVFARDNGQCVDCGSTERLHCDHIVPLAHGGTNDMDNLESRCVTCHGRKTATQQNPKKPPPNGGGEPGRYGSQGGSQSATVTAHKEAHNGKSEPIGEPSRLSRETRQDKKGKEEGSAHALPARAREAPPEIGENLPVLRKNKALRTLLPAEWRPSAASIDHAIRLGFDADWAQNQANRMRNWAEMSNAVVDDWDRRFDRWMEVESYTIRQAKAAAEPKSVHQQIREAGNLPTFLGPTPDADNHGIRLTAIAGGKA